MSDRVQKTGASKLRAAGLVQLQVPLPPADRDMVRAAAALSGSSAQQWAAGILVSAAREVLKKIQKKIS